MPDSDRRKRREALKDDPRDFEHRMHSAKMGLFTYVGKRVLPEGYWTSRTQKSELSSAERVMHLTFDDGPNPECTRELLSMLAEQETVATFFFIGENVRRYPHLVEEVAKAGHAIGNHSLTHPFMPLLTLPQLEHELDETNHAIELITGQKPRLFRPPYGIIDKRGAELLKLRGMKAVYWGAVADDWQRVGEDVVVKRIMKQVVGEEIIVLHEGHNLGRQNVSAGRQLIQRIKNMGFAFDAIA